MLYLNGSRFFSLVLALGLLGFIPDALARAGGGGGGRGGLLELVLLPLLIVYSLWVTHLAQRRGREAKAALEQARSDPAWHPGDLRVRVAKVYYKVQEAWTQRDQSIASDCMSERLYQTHKLQTDQMIRDGIRNVLEAISLTDSTIVQIADFEDDTQDSFWALIEGSMIDYTVREATGEIIKGKQDEPEYFKELWKFIRTDHDWVLDRITDHLVRDLLKFKSSIETE